MHVKKTTLDGVLEVNLENFSDHRGEYVETYNLDLYSSKGIDVRFIQDDYSRSVRNVFRGIHGDQTTWKLVSCLSGEIKLVVVNCDKDSEHFGKYEFFILSEENRKQILIPPKFGNGHYVVSESAIFFYKQSTYYSREDQFSYKYDEAGFGIDWGENFKPILSKRDS